MEIESRGGHAEGQTHIVGPFRYSGISERHEMVRLDIFGEIIRFSNSNHANMTLEMLKRGSVMRCIYETSL